MFHTPAHKQPAPKVTKAQVRKLCGMPTIEDIIAFERGQMDEDQVVDFIQSGIDAGWVWQLQGFYGRTAMSLINAGLCMTRPQ